MKKVILAVMVVVLALFFTSTVYAGGIFIVPENTPAWVIQEMDGQPYWHTSKYAYGVGRVKGIKNLSLRRSTAQNRARNALVKGLGLNGIAVSGVEIHGVWEHPDTHEFYALARIPIKIIPVEK